MGHYWLLLQTKRTERVEVGDASMMWSPGDVIAKLRLVSGWPTPRLEPAVSMAHDPRTGERLCHHHGHCTHSVVKTFYRAFALGCAAKTVINLVSVLVAKHKHGNILYALANPIDLILLACSSAIDWRFGLFLATFSGGFKAILCALRRLRHKDDTLNSLIAASVSLAIAEPEDRATLALYTFVRAGEFVARLWVHQKRIPDAIANFEHYDVLLMGLAAREVLYCYVFEPHHLNKSYLRFLYKHGAVDLRALNMIVTANATSKVDHTALTNYLTETGGLINKALVPHDDHIPLSCELIHPGGDCASSKVTFFLKGLQRSLAVYAPLHAVFSLILFFRSRHIDVTHFLRTLKKWVENVAYSSVFLSSYCTIAWIAFCIWSRTHRSLPLLKLSLIACGLSTLFDHKGRRMELALYCVPKALEAGYSRYVQDKRIPRLRYGEFPLFAVAAAGVIYCYQKRIDAGAIRGTVRSMLGWMWGPC